MNMSCPNCGGNLYQIEDNLTGGTYIQIKCDKCGFYDFKNIPYNSYRINITCMMVE